jgi:MFS family permease
LKQIKYIIIIGLFHQIVIQGSRPIIALLGFDLGASKFEIGLIAATFAFFPLIFAVHAGAWIDRWGYFRPIVLGSLGVSVALFLPFLFPSIETLFISQIFAGISQIFVNISLQNALGLHVAKENRDKIFGWFSFAVSGGQFLGPLLVGFGSEQYNYVIAFLIATIFSLVPIFVGLLLHKKSQNQSSTDSKKEKQVVDPVQLSPIGILRIKGMHQAIIAGMLAQFTKDVMMTYFPLYAMEEGMSGTEIGFILGLQGLSSMFIRILQGNLLKRFSRKRVLLVSLFIAGFTFGIFTMYHHISYFSILAIIMGLGLGLAQPISMVMVVNLSPGGKSGKVLGVRMAGNRFAQVISPILFGVIAQFAGITPVFWVCGGILIAGSLYSTWNMEE